MFRRALSPGRAVVFGAAFLAALVPAAARGGATLGGSLPGPLPLFPADNPWNADISAAPVDPASDAYIDFLGPDTTCHPDFGGEASPGSVAIYGFPYAVIDGDLPLETVSFLYADESDGFDLSLGESYPFYPIPEEAIAEPHWVEGGEPGEVDLRSSSDRHLLLIDGRHRWLYELYNVWYDGAQWQAGSGAFFDLATNHRRPDGWTSADAAGLAILPGLVRYDEVYEASGEIGHAFRVTVRQTDGYVYPASHRAGDTAGALPMGARLRLRADVDISGHPEEIQRIFRAMKRHGLIVADNGSDLFVSGTFDTRWDNDVLNPAFRSLRGADFEVVELGYRPARTERPLLRSAGITSLDPPTPPLDQILPLEPVRDGYIGSFAPGEIDPEAVLRDEGRPLVLYGLDGPETLYLVKARGPSRAPAAGATVSVFY